MFGDRLKWAQRAGLASLCAILIFLVASRSEAQDDRCQVYAESAVSQHMENQSLGCGYTGNRWSADYQGHYNWCKGGGAADAERQARERQLNACKERKGLVPSACDDYARSAVSQNQENQRLGCGYTGGRWTDDYQGHFNWCKGGASQASMEGERRTRDSELQRCRERIKSTETAIPSETPGGPYNSIQSYNYQDHYIRHRDFLGEITRISSDLDRKDATFKVVPGLVGGSSVSFESANYPGYYLRHQGFRIKLHKFSNDNLFRQDASFMIRPGLADGSWSSFESVNYPGYYIRHRNFHLYLERGTGDLFRKDVTFRLVPAMAEEPGAGLFKSRWDKISGQGPAWTTGWQLNSTVRGCGHSQPHCSYCPGNSPCGVYPDGAVITHAPYGAQGNCSVYWQLKCTSVPQ